MKAITLVLGLLVIVRALRHLDATNKRFNKHGWMDVRRELSPENHFSMRVENASPTPGRQRHPFTTEAL